MATLLSALGAILLGAIGWFGLEFIGRPVRSFFDLRRKIHEQMMFLNNVPVPDSRNPDPVPLLAGDDVFGARDDTPEEKAFDEAVVILRRLGAEVKAFGETEYLAATAVRRLGFDPVRAGNNLIGLSNNLGRRPVRAQNRKEIQTALRLR